mgnify:CR=1 FL=1
MLSQKIQDDLMSAYQKVYEEKRGHAAGDSDIEKQASQLASDVRYKAKGKSKPGASKEELRKLYISILGSSPAPSAVKSMAKDKLLGEEVVVEMSARETLNKKMKEKKVNTIIKKDAAQDIKTEKKLAKAMMGEGSAYGITKGDGMSFPERLKAKAKKKKEKMKMEEEKKALPTTKMYRKAGNLSRMALSKGLDSKEGGKAQKRSEKIVSTISTAKEKERFDKMTTPKAQLRNEEVVNESKGTYGTMRNKLTGLPTLTPEPKKSKETPITADQRRQMKVEAMDPVGKEDGDINNDGKKDSTDSYLMKRRKAIGKAIAKKRGKVKEGFSAWRIDLDFNEQVKK